MKESGIKESYKEEPRYSLETSGRAGLLPNLLSLQSRSDRVEPKGGAKESRVGNAII